MNIEITHPEREILLSVLSSSLDDLRDEICHTDQYEFKENLRYRKALLQQFVLKLQSPHVLNN